jgi:hypothetical protein
LPVFQRNVRQTGGCDHGAGCAENKRADHRDFTFAETVLSQKQCSENGLGNKASVSGGVLSWPCYNDNLAFTRT